MAAKPRSEPKNPDDPRGQFGPFLREWIERHHGGDEKRLADSLGMTDRAIRKWMLGDSGPAFSDLETVAQLLGFADWADMARAIVKHAKHAKKRR